MQPNELARTQGEADMQPRSILAVLMLGSLLATGGVAAATDTKSGNDAATMMPAPGNDTNRAMDKGMMQGGAMMQGSRMADGPGKMGSQGMTRGSGMMGMMSGCDQMMSGAAASMPQLPPGNERLQLKMQGEMMQRMGEVLSKYADQVKEDATPGR